MAEVKIKLIFLLLVPFQTLVLTAFASSFFSPASGSRLSTVYA